MVNAIFLRFLMIFLGFFEKICDFCMEIYGNGGNGGRRGVIGQKMHEVLLLVGAIHAELCSDIARLGREW